MHLLVILGTALLLGVRHGIDWDHIAAIVDIAGASAAQPFTDSSGGGRARALVLCLLYALGHAFVVAVLGVAAIAFAAILPAWVDQFSERIVGITLLVLGLYVVYTVSRSWLRRDANFSPASRWMVVLSLLRGCVDRCRGIDRRGDVNSDTRSSYGAFSVFLIGMLHGIGAETGTQVLLIAAAGGASTHGFGMAMLVSFILGLLVSNSFVALIATRGIAQSARFKPIYLASSALVAVFSLVVGGFFVLGASSHLPDLQVALSRKIDLLNN